MAITKINLVERFATIHADGSIGIMPESYTLEKTRHDCFDSNEPDPHQQAKVGKVQFHIVEILHDPVDEMMPEDTAERLKVTREAMHKSLDILGRYGQTDGDHHKAWVIDQTVRALTGDGYENFVRRQKQGDEGPETYDWDIGVAP